MKKITCIQNIETPILCTDVPKLERKEDSGNKTKGYYANKDR